MYEPRRIVGDFFEQRVMRLFDLVRADVESLGIAPDLRSKDGSFFVEVKASAYDNGGVINRTQLRRFSDDISVRRFYAFVYHSISRDMTKDYPTPRRLKCALDLRSLYLFPFSIVKAHFEKSRKRIHPKHDDFVQLRESLAQAIFEGDKSAWEHLGLEQEDYKMAKPHEKIHIVTKQGHLEQQILDSLHPGVI